MTEWARAAFEIMQRELGMPLYCNDLVRLAVGLQKVTVRVLESRIRTEIHKHILDEQNMDLENTKSLNKANLTDCC